MDLRRQLVDNMIITINDFQRKGHDVVLMIDANEGNKRGSAVARLIYECNLADAHGLSGKTDPPPTYHQGSDKIDFVLVLASLVSSVRSASILALHDGYLSDHCALLVDFDAALLFMSDTSPVTPPAERRLTSSNPRAVHKYITAMRKQVAKHNILDQVLALQRSSNTGEWTDASVREWEKIDRLLAEARASAKGKCEAKRTGILPWSPALEK